jgi:hypothetical protein
MTSQKHLADGDMPLDRGNLADDRTHQPGSPGHADAMQDRQHSAAAMRDAC